MRRGLLLIVLAIAGCGREAPPADDYDGPPLVVYSAYSDTSYLPALFAEFTRDTGIPVVVRHRGDAENLADMAAKSGSQPADLLMTSSAWAAWQAADEGLLRPLPPDLDVSAVAASLRDPDDHWLGLSVRTLAIYHAPGVKPPAGFPELAAEGYRGRLCLATSGLPLQRMLLAELLAGRDARGTELMVRRWVDNLAMPPLADYGEVIRAVEQGRCALGIVSRESLPDTDARSVSEPALPAIDVEAIGIGRHARSPEAAARLIRWLLRADVQARHAEATGRFPSAGDDSAARFSARDIAAAAYLYQDATRLAERARYY